MYLVALHSFLSEFFLLLKSTEILTKLKLHDSSADKCLCHMRKDASCKW